MTQRNQPTTPQNYPTPSVMVLPPGTTDPGELGSDADPIFVELPSGAQLAGGLGTALSAVDFQKQMTVDPGVPTEVAKLKTVLGPGDQCWSLPAKKLGLKTPPKDGVAYAGAQELIDAARSEHLTVIELPKGTPPPSTLGENQAIIFAVQDTKDPKNPYYIEGHCGVGDKAGGVSDFTKPTPNSDIKIPPKISYSSSPDDLMNRKVTRERNDDMRTTFTVQPMVGKRIIIITK